jgi:hypothetical protein
VDASSLLAVSGFRRAKLLRNWLKIGNVAASFDFVAAHLSMKANHSASLFSCPEEPEKIVVIKRLALITD